MKVGSALDTKRDISRKLYWLVLFVLFQTSLIITLPPSCRADDKNGVSPNTVSLPSGPGSIEGLGESFQPMLNTGTARYSVNISLPPGAGGHSPSLSLDYESGHGDGFAGIGWKFGPGAVCRKTDMGIPRYVDGPNGVNDDHDGETDEADEEDIIIGLEDEDLVRLADGTYRARIEGTFIRYRKVGDYWEAHLKDGTRLEFGLTPQGRVTEQTGERIFKWLLEKSTDTNGNVIEFYYESFPDSTNQKYLAEIRYGPGAPPRAVFYFVNITYEDRPNWRKDYRSGFLIKTTKRMAQIDIGIQGVSPDQCAPGDWNSDSAADALIRRYVLSYDATHPHISFLSQVTQFGSDGVSYLPPITFSYSVFSPDPSISASASIITSSTAPSTLMDSQLVELIDMNRDGLPDMLHTDIIGDIHKYYLNLGMATEGDNPEIEWDAGQNVSSPDDLALELRLADEKVHLADMDGNGISDLVHTPYSQEVQYYLNQGDGTWGERRFMNILDTTPPAPFAITDARTSDMDFDKRMDVVRSADTGYRTWFNLGQGRYSKEVRTSGASYQGRVIRFSDEAVHLADVNGDRMSDVVQIRMSQVIYCAGMGHGNFDTAVTIPIPDTVLMDGENSQVERARLEDINGDGLADLVVERALASELWYWINLGTDAFSNRHVITDMPAVSGSTMVTRWADINGNGTTDLIYADSNASSRLVALDIGELAGGSAHANLLTGIDNGLGVKTEITYKSSTEYCIQARQDGTPWSETIPFPVSVIAGVKTTTGLDLDMTSGADEYIKTYEYRDGFYEDRRKAFRGFEQVAVTEPGDATSPTLVSVHSFFTGGPDGLDNDGDSDIDEVLEDLYREEDALKGMVKSLEMRALDGHVFSREENSWLIRNLALSTGNVEVRFAYNEATEKWIYEGTGSPETIRATFTYDDFGNATEERRYGALSLTGDEKFTFTEYINDTILWILGVPQRQYVTDQGGQQYSETLSYYDGADYTGLPLGQVARGNMTRQEGWVGDTSYINRIRNAYDAYGNIIGVLDPNGNRRTIAYDTTLHTYPVQEDIEVGGGHPDLTVIAVYNLGPGVITSSIDFNGHQTLYGHDFFGRLTSIVKPGDTETFPTLTFSYTMADPEQSLVYSYDSLGNLTIQTGIQTASAVRTSAREVSGETGTFDRIQYVDGMGRRLALVEEGEADFVAKEAVLFNTKGSPLYAFLPYETANWDFQAPLAVSSAKREIHYDAAGREVVIINPPDKDSVITQSSIQYLPLSKITTDENSNSRTFYSDGLERLTQVQELNQGETYTTTYAYDPLGNLTQITDALNNVKTLSYDGLKRRTEVNDPDRGRMEYTYDDAGNIIQTEDNKGQIVVYTYDRANRMLTEDYMDGAGITPDISFLYDVPSAEYPDFTNTKGRLSRVQDLSGAQFFSYDSRGNARMSVKRIHHNGTDMDYRTVFTHDTMGRVISMIYPDGDQVSYTYNNRAILESVPGFIDNIDYDVSGQISSIEYANGVSTSYAYDQRKRLTDIDTVSTLQANAVLQDLSYTMDGVGNINAIVDGRSLPVDSPRNATQDFLYDDLYRLTHAEGSGYGAIDFQYDRIGNMIFKGSPAVPDPDHIDDTLVNLGTLTCGGAGGTSGRGPRLPGDPPGPHAVTATQSGQLYDYDDNGNMTGHEGGDVYTWDFKDRLTRVLKGTSDTRYTYDYSGQRVSKSVNDGTGEKTTHYISKAFEVREDKAIKYISSGQRRIARITGRLSDNTGPMQQNLMFQSGWNFFSLEVHPNDPAIDVVLAGVAGNFTEVWAYNPVAQSYVGYVPAEALTELSELHAQTGYMIKVTEPVTLTITGARATDDISLQTGWNLIPGPTDTQTPISEALSDIEGEYEAVWGYEPAGNTWRGNNPYAYDFLNDLNILRSGKAYWIQMTAPAQLPWQQEQRSIHFYHPDHLGSSNMLTDENGMVAESTEFYPFGRPRYEESTGIESAYKYTGKELDSESGLMYYEARYYEPVIGRFVSVDPMSTTVGLKGLSDPQSLNYYAYTQNNPLKYVDPDGRELTLASLPKSEQQTVLGWLHELTSDKLSVSQEGKIEIKNLSSSRIPNVGTSLVRELIAHKSSVNIRKEKFGGTLLAEGFTSNPSNAEVTFSLSSTPRTLTALSGRGYLVEEKFASAIQLGHELIHSWRVLEGKHIDPSKKVFHTYKRGFARLGFEHIPEEEYATVGFGKYNKEKYTEIKLREQLRSQGKDIKPRGAYSPTIRGFWRGSKVLSE